MDKRTELEIQRDKYEAVIEERDALINSLRGENAGAGKDRWSLAWHPTASRFLHLSAP